MNKVIFKTALKTLLAVLIALVAAAAILCLGFPQNVADICEKTGSYSAATVFASLRYTYTGDVNDLARCAEDSILSGNSVNIRKYCGKLVAEEEFATVCEEKDGAAVGFYRQYIYGNYAVALYNGGEKALAVETAEAALNGVSGFPEGNAYGSLAMAIVEARDAETANTVLEKIRNLSPSDSEYEIKYYNAVLKVLGDINV